MDSFLRGKPFYGREWLFGKLIHYLELKNQAQIPGVLLVGGPGAGKSAACAEICFPTVVISPQAQLNSRLLAYHFCQFHEAESLTADYFVQNILGQLEESSLMPEFAEKWSLAQDSLISSDPKEIFLKILEVVKFLFFKQDFKLERAGFIILFNKT